MKDMTSTLLSRKVSLAACELTGAIAYPVLAGAEVVA